MKKLLIFTISILLVYVLTPLNVSAHVGESDGNIEETQTNTHETIEEVLPEILGIYGKEIIQDLDCNEITDEDFGRIGEAWMESIHPGETHEIMDEMMSRERSGGEQSGEGFESLELAHIRMGENYLGCSDGDSDFMGMSGMMGLGQNTSMMNGQSWSNSGSVNILWSVIGILFAILLLVLIRYFWKKGGGEK